MILPKSSLSYLYHLDFNRSVYSSAIKEMVQKRDYASLVEVIKFMEGPDLDDRHRMQTEHELANALLPSMRDEHYGPDSHDRGPFTALVWSKAAEDFFGRMLSIAKKKPEYYTSQTPSILDAAVRFHADSLIAPTLSILKKQKIEKSGVRLIGAWANAASMRFIEGLEAKGKLTPEVRLQLIEGHLERRTSEHFGRGYDETFVGHCLTPDLEQYFADKRRAFAHLLDLALQRGCLPFFAAYPNLVREQAPYVDFRTGDRSTVLMTLNENFLKQRLTFEEWQGVFRALISSPIGLDINEVVDGKTALLVIARILFEPSANTKPFPEDNILKAIVEMLEAGADPHLKINSVDGAAVETNASVIERVEQNFPERAQVMRTWMVKEQIKRVAQSAATGSRTQPGA
jgi:hypothetical protein